MTLVIKEAGIKSSDTIEIERDDTTNEIDININGVWAASFTDDGKWEIADRTIGSENNKKGRWKD